MAAEPPREQHRTGRARPTTRALARSRLASREAVAVTTHGLHESIEPARLEQRAQSTDVHVDGALLDHRLASPYRVEQLAAGVGALRVAHEELEQAELGWSDLERFTGDRDAVADRVERQRLDTEHPLLLGQRLAGAAQHGANPCGQLGGRERSLDRP